MNHHPRILVAGCGYTGARCADFLFAEDFAVTGLVSSEASARRLADKPYPVLAADASRPDLLRGLAGDLGRTDVLVHCLSRSGGRDADAYRVTYLQTLLNLAEILAPAFSIFTSSTSVYPQNDGRWVTEESPTGGTPASLVLLEAEKAALASGGGVVRLAGIYGPGRSRFIEAALAVSESGSTGAPPVLSDLQRAGRPFSLPEPAASPRSDTCLNLIHRDDAAAALCHLAKHRLAGIYNAADDCPGCRSDLAEAIRAFPDAHLPGRARWPQRAAAFPSQACGKRVSNSKLRATGWSPRYPSIVAALRDDTELRASLRINISR